MKYIRRPASSFATCVWKSAFYCQTAAVAYPVSKTVKTFRMMTGFNK
ncbi:MAG: EAST1 family heat-stable enterotoxin [Bacteroidales bacterium]|nr:EAST1 family heat-stable enterotoxin [Bacteroidales bacterium]